MERLLGDINLFCTWRRPASLEAAALLLTRLFSRGKSLGDAKASAIAFPRVWGEMMVDAADLLLRLNNDDIGCCCCCCCCFSCNSAESGCLDSRLFDFAVVVVLFSLDVSPLGCFVSLDDFLFLEFLDDGQRPLVGAVSVAVAIRNWNPVAESNEMTG